MNVMEKNTCGIAITKQEVLDLMDKKEDIDKELSNLFNLLQQNGVGLTEPLVDRDDYPRADIDVEAVRCYRHRIHCLQTDLKDIMSRIETGICALHSQEKSCKLCCLVNSEEINDPFAQVDNVAPNSPASLGGLQKDDELLKFGSITANNFINLKDIQNIAQHRKGRQVDVIVRRTDKKHYLHLIPQDWNGPGLLGCHIVPIEHIER